MRELRWLVATALPLLAVVSVASVPDAATATGGGSERAADDRAGTLAIDLAPATRKQLRRQSLSVRPVGAAQGGPRRLRIPVTGGEVGRLAQLELRGAVRLTSTAGKGRRSVRARLVRAIVSTERTYVTAAIGGDQVTLLVLDRPGVTPFDPLSGTVRIERSPVRLANFTRNVLRDRLRAPRLRSPLGRARLVATATPAPTESQSPPLRQRPAGAVDITAGELTWRARESWVDYLHAAGEQGGTRISNGAVDGPAEVVPPSSDPRIYEFRFPFESGWYDPATGAANVEFGGTVTFFKLVQPFDIDLDAGDPEIELGGPDPRAIMRMDGRRNNSDQQNRRAVVVDLEQDAVTPTETPVAGGTAHAYEDIPARNPGGSTAWPIAGYYQPGDPWGSLSVSFTVTEAGE